MYGPKIGLTIYKFLRKFKQLVASAKLHSENENLRRTCMVQMETPTITCPTILTFRRKF